MKHCMEKEYSKQEQRLTCYKCAAPLADNQLVKDAYKMNTTVCWAKTQLRILADMARDRGQSYIADEIIKITNGMETLDGKQE